MSHRPNDHSLFEAAARALAESDPDRKVELTQTSAARWRDGHLTLDPSLKTTVAETPGRPARLELVAPRQLAARKLSSTEGRAAMIHAVAHIEFNAIDLAWDAVQRFRDLPAAFHADWVRVAEEESRHFALMRERLQDLGYDYGDFPAHDGLWEMARQTAHDPLVRMALVPRVLEARGLDVTPGMIERFRAADDAHTADRLGVILREEVGHVAAGSRWFRELCAQRGLDSTEHYFALIARYISGGIRGPLNRADRRSAGFSEEELERLQTLAQS